MHDNEEKLIGRLEDAERRAFEIALRQAETGDLDAAKATILRGFDLSGAPAPAREVVNDPRAKP